MALFSSCLSERWKKLALVPMGLQWGSLDKMKGPHALGNPLLGGFEEVQAIRVQKYRKFRGVSTGIDL
jgi:hypothetical protein